MREIRVEVDGISDAEKDRIARVLIKELEDYRIFINDELMHVTSYK
jgi:hypothetical protein